MTSIALLRTGADLAPFTGCALVPTMGALHEGHASLIRAAASDAQAEVRARAQAGISGAGERCGDPRSAGPRLGATGRPVVVTIFVNPTQFGPAEDFARYPRTLEADLELAERAGAVAAFVPTADEIYPRGLEAAARDAAAFPLPPTATEPGLEDRVRPGHFGGVCLVVARLFELFRPSIAYFGEKDWQQLRVISQMVERCADGRGGEGVPSFPRLQIAACPIVREASGLAMSSRNRYLSQQDQSRARTLASALRDAQAGVAGASASDEPGRFAAIEALMRQRLSDAGFEVDYAVVRDALTLRPPDPGALPDSLRLLVAARVAGVRLIDNAPGAGS